ncbi:MAG: hypothetical protein ACI9YL_002197 [Luteibaculaceae bacterium]|jgi:hypothetical protein
MSHFLKVLVPLLGLFLFCANSSFAQNQFFGKITDQFGVGIPAVNVRIDGTTRGVVTDVDGDFYLDLADLTSIKLFISHSGFQKKNGVFEANTKPDRETIILKTLQIKTVVIEEGRTRNSTFSKIKPKDIAKIPTPTMDFNAVLNTQLGVAMNNELSSNYNVRGGNFDENLVYVNGMEVYRPFLARSGQQEGLSFVNPDLVSNVKFSAGGFDAQYGDKMSSVLDILYKKPTKFAGSASASLLGGSFHLENKYKDWTFIGGLRYRANGYILNSLDNQGDYKPVFFDFQSYITRKLGSKWDVGLLTNFNYNKYEFIPKSRKTEFGTVNEALQLSIFFEGKEQSGYATGFGTLQFSNQVSSSFLQQFSAALFSTSENETYDVTGAYFIDELERDPGSEEYGEAVKNVGIGGSIRHARNFLDAQVATLRYRGFKSIDNKYLQFGASVSSEIISDQIKEWELIDSAGYSTPYGSSAQRDAIDMNYFLKSAQDMNNLRFQSYIQNQWTWYGNQEDQWNVTLGVRGHYWNLNKELLLSPRATISYQPDWTRIRRSDSAVIANDILFRLSGGLYAQAPFYREMRDLNGKINENIKAQKSAHIVAGMDYNFFAFNRPFKFITEAYFKYMWDLNPYELDNIRVRYYADNIAKGYATGLDLKVNGEFIDGVESWISLGFLKTEEDLLNDRDVKYFNAAGDEIVQGYTFDNVVADSTVASPGFIPRPTDQLVNFSMFFQDEMPNRPSLKAHISLNYGAPLPFGPPDYNRFKDILRTSGYRRVDIGFTKQLAGGGIKKTRRFFKQFEEAWASLEFFNIMDINNTVNYSWIKDVSGRQYAIPNFLTGRRINLKLVVRF